MKKTALIAVLAGLLMAACNIDGSFVINYDHPERYSTGSATIEQPVKDINIEWFDGEIEILYSDAEKITISEESNADLADSLHMRHYVNDNGKLDIRFCAKGKYNNIKLNGLNKRLTIEVPRSIRLDDISLSCVSGHMCIDSVWCNELSIEGVSNKITAFYPTLPNKIDVEGVSSDIMLHVAPTAGMTIEMEGVSTNLTCELPAKTENNKTIVGNGQSKIDVEGVSSKLTVKEM